MKKKIMVVDDEPDCLTVIKYILEKNNYNVSTAFDGKECLKKLKDKVKPNLILLDIMMPGMPTKEIIKEIPNIKIVLVSVVKVTEAEKEGLLEFNNVVDFIPKPFNVEELLNKVKKTLC